MNQAATQLSQYLDRDAQTIEALMPSLVGHERRNGATEEHIELIASENYCSPGS